MGQFKPMVKMETTEPSVELKLKRGGEVKKQMGGAMGRPAAMAGMPARGGMMPAAAPARPSMAARRRAMMAMPAGAAPAGPVGGAGRMMKEGGESKAEHKAEMAKMAKTAKELKAHEAKPASKAHKGLKTGGVANAQGGYAMGGKVSTTYPDHSPAKTGDVKMGNGGGYATGGVAKANAGGYKRGGKIKKMADGGILGMGQMIGDQGLGGKSNTAYGGLEQIRGGSQGIESALGNIASSIGGPGKTGLYKKGGSAKKAYATGGRVDSGAPVAMPQGRKAPSKPVSIDRLSGTFKDGGKVDAYDKIKSMDIPAEAKSMLQQAENEKAYKAFEEQQKRGEPSLSDMLSGIPKMVKGMFNRTPSPGAVTKTEKAVTVEPVPKKRGGAC